MFGTSGFFRGLNCPHYARGPGRTCRRPFCHFRHVRNFNKDTEEQSKTTSVSTSEKKGTESTAGTKTKNGPTSKSDYVSTSLPNWKKKKSKKLSVAAIHRRGGTAPTATYIPTPPLAQIQKKQAPATTVGFDNPFGHSKADQDEYDPTDAALGNQVGSRGKYSLDGETCNQTEEYVPTGGNSISQNAQVDKYSYEPAVHDVSEYDPLETNEAVNSAPKYSISTGPATDLEYDPLENSSLKSVQSSDTTDSYISSGGKIHEEYDPTEGQSSKVVTDSSKYSVGYSDNSDNLNALYSVEEYDPLATVKAKDGNLYEYTPVECSYAPDNVEVEYHPTVSSPFKRKASSDITQENAKKMKSGIVAVEDDDNDDDLQGWEIDAWFSEDEDETTNHKSRNHQKKGHNNNHKSKKQLSTRYDISSEDEDPLVIDFQSADAVSQLISADEKLCKNKAEVKITKDTKELKKKHKSVKSLDAEFVDEDGMQGVDIIDVRNSDGQTGTKDVHLDTKEDNDGDLGELPTENESVCENAVTSINDEDANSKDADKPAQITKPRVSSEQLSDFFSKRLQQPAKSKLKNRKRTTSENIFSSVSKSTLSKDGDKVPSLESSKNKASSDEERGNIFSLMTKSASKDRTESISSESNAKKLKEAKSSESAKDVDKDSLKKSSKHPQQKNCEHKSKERKQSDSTLHKSSSSKDKHVVSEKSKLHKSSNSKDVGKQKISDKEKSSKSNVVCDKMKPGTNDKKSSEKGSAKNVKEPSKGTGGSKVGELKTSSSMPKDKSGKHTKEKSRTSSISKHISGDKLVSKTSSNKHKTSKSSSHVKIISGTDAEGRKSNNSSTSGVKDKSLKAAAKTFDLFGSLSESSSDDRLSSSKRTPSLLKTSTTRKDPSKKLQKDVFDLSSTTSSDNDLTVRKKKFVDKVSKEMNRSQSLESHRGAKSKDVHVFDLTSDSSDTDMEMIRPSLEVNGHREHKEVHRSQSWAPQGVAGRSSSKRRISEQDLFGEDSSSDEVKEDGDEVIFVKETSKDDISYDVINLLSSDESDNEDYKTKEMKRSSKKSASSNGAIKDKVKYEDQTHHCKEKHTSGTKDSSVTKSLKSKHKHAESEKMKEKHSKSVNHKHTKIVNLNHHKSKSDSSKQRHKSNVSSKHRSGEKKGVSSKSKEVIHSANKRHSTKDKEADKLKKSNHTSIQKDKTSSGDKSWDKSKLNSSSLKSNTCKKDKTSAISKSNKNKTETPVTCVTPNGDGSDAENYALSDDDESMDLEIPEDFHMDDTDISFSETDTYEECLKIYNEGMVTVKDTMKKQVPSSSEESEELVSPAVVGKKRVAHAPKYSSSYVRKRPTRRAQPSPALVCHSRFKLAQQEALKKMQSPPPQRSPDKTYPISTEKKRVAHLPNFAAPSNTLPRTSSSPNKRVSRVPSSPSSASPSSSTPYVSSRRMIMEKKFAAVHRANSGWEIAGKTLATTADKGGRRMAHVPTKVSPRPVIPASHGGKVPSVVRQRYLNLFIDEFLKTSDAEQEAFDLGLKEEKAIFDRANSKPIYLNLSINNLKRLRTARADPSKAVPSSPPPKNAVSHFAVLGGKAHAQNAFTLHRSAGRPVDQGHYQGKDLYDKLKPYILTEEQLWDNGYPKSAVIPGQAEVKEQESKKPAAADPNQQVCCRCGKTFLRRPDGQYITKETCTFHWGKLWRQKVGGMIEHRFSCCSGDSETKGCCLSRLHVTEDKTSNLSGFMKTYSKTPPRDVGHPGVYALDCEMCYTVKGMELTRVTVVDDEFQQVYDSLVKPDNEVVDYNTRFSGITEDDLKSVETKLHNVQAVLLNMFSSETILIGHSLESDMLSLKLIHETVVDTSVAFPHKLGPPYKRALRNLMAEYVKKIIQSDVGGHDSMEDAKSCMELMVWKLKEDAKTKR